MTGSDAPRARTVGAPASPAVGAGCGASPALAGKYVYLSDNQGTTVVLRPGRTYDEVARNVIEESRENKEQVQNLATPAFDSTRMYYRTPGYLYCIGR